MRRFVARIGIILATFLILTASVSLVFRETLLRKAGGFLVVDEELRPADAIVMLSGSIPDRILEVVDLYQEGWAPRIVLTQEGPLPGLDALRAKGASLPEHHELNLSVAAQLGVPRAAITLVDTPAWSTVTEAHALLAFLRQAELRTVLLVTSKGHTRRAAMTYRALAHPDITIVVRASRHDPFDPDHWWKRRPYVRRVVIEYLKLANYLLVDRWK